MAQMLVEDLIAILQKVDPKLPIHKHVGGGEFSGVDTEYAGHWLGYQELMQSKTDSNYFATTNDKIWKKVRRQFGKPFRAVVFW